MSNEQDPESQLATPCNLRSESYCLRCLDCYQCQYMKEELLKHPPETQIWVCSGCAGYLSQAAKQRDLALLLTGYYTEGQCGCYGCDHQSIILQLVLGPIGELVKEM